MAWPTTPTAGDIVTSALQELAAYGAGEPQSAEDAAWGLQKLQRLVDSWNAQREAIFNVSFQLFTLTPNHSPHTIGPVAADFAQTPRPVRVESCSFVLNGGSSNPVDLPVRIRDDDWWAANPLKSLTSSVVTDLYYSSDQPNGKLYFYPISNVAAPVRLELWSSVASPLLATTALALPPGYADALTYNLAVALAPSFEKMNLSPLLVSLAQKSLAIVFNNNNDPPRIDTAPGTPGAGGSGRPDFNWLTGMRE